MKKTKKMLALVLALMMAFTILAMPAMAAGEDEGIMPLYEMRMCPVHHESEAVTTAQVNYYEYGVTCSKHSTEHTHRISGTEYTFACGYVQHAPSFCTLGN